MHDALYNLKEMLCKELEELGEQGELTAGSLETVDKLAHAIKDLDHVIMSKEEEGGRSFRGMSYDGYRGGSYRGSYDGDGGSYARGRGSGAKRYSDGRYAPYSRDGYSRAEDMTQMLRNIADQAPDERTRKDLHRLAEQMESQG